MTNVSGLIRSCGELDMRPSDAALRLQRDVQTIGIAANVLCQGQRRRAGLDHLETLRGVLCNQSARACGVMSFSTSQLNSSDCPDFNGPCSDGFAEPGGTVRINTSFATAVVVSLQDAAASSRDRHTGDGDRASRGTGRGRNHQRRLSMRREKKRGVRALKSMTLMVVSKHAISAVISDHRVTPVRIGSTTATVAAAICDMPSTNRSLSLRAVIEFWKRPNAPSGQRRPAAVSTTGCRRNFDPLSVPNSGMRPELAASPCRESWWEPEST